MKNGIVDYFNLKEGWGRIRCQEPEGESLIDFKLSTHRELEFRGKLIYYLGPEVDGPPYPVPKIGHKVLFWPSKREPDCVAAWAYKSEADKAENASRPRHQPRESDRNGEVEPAPLERIPVQDEPPPKALVEAIARSRNKTPANGNNLTSLARAYDDGTRNNGNGVHGDSNRPHSGGGGNPRAWMTEKPRESKYAEKRRQRFQEQRT